MYNLPTSHSFSVSTKFALQTHRLALSHWLVTKLRVTRSHCCCCAPKSRKACGSPVLRWGEGGRVALRGGSGRSGKTHQAVRQHLSQRSPLQLSFHILHPLRLSWRVSLEISRRKALRSVFALRAFGQRRRLLRRRGLGSSRAICARKTT